MYTSEVIAAQHARDAQERQDHYPLLDSAVYDANAEANAAAVKAGYPKGASQWVAQFWYADRHVTYSTEETKYVRKVQYY